MKTLIRVVLFYAIAFIFTIILSIIQRVAGIDAGRIVLPEFGPGIAALIMVMMFRRDNIKINITFKGIPIIKILIAFCIPIIVSVFLFISYSKFAKPLVLSLPNTSYLIMMLGGMLVGAFGEEVGWRGYLQNLLDKRINGFISFLIVGILWGFWHVGNYQNGLLYVLFFVLSTIGFSATISWLLQGTEHNVILASSFHFAINACFYILKDAISDLRLIVINGIIWILIAVVIVICNKKRFMYYENGSVDAIA
jgi:membrane protease YdiL (CAAX protease family)